MIAALQTRQTCCKINNTKHKQKRLYDMNMMAEVGGHEDLADGMLKAFFNMGMQCLLASVELWPEDEVLASWKRQAETITTSGDERAIQALALKCHAEFHSSFRNHYELLRKRDEAILNSAIPVLDTLNAGVKWRGAHPSVRETLWEYATQLAQFSSMYSMYSSCPGGMMGKVTSMAQSLAKRAAQGEVRMEDINPLELSQQMMSQLDEKDLESFGQALLGQGGGNLVGMMGMVQGMVGQMGPQLGPQMAELTTMLNNSGGNLPLSAVLGGMGGLGNLLGSSGAGGAGGAGGRAPMPTPFADMLSLVSKK